MRGKTYKDSMNHLHDNLRHSGKHPIPLAFADGARLLVLPEHGRLIGLYPAEGDANFLWTNPALDAAESSRLYFSRAGWSNPGGDRTWLAPELDLFIGDPRRPFETYAVPSALDPGNWKPVSAMSAEVILENRTRLRLLRAGRDVDVRLVKTYTPAVNPLRGSPADGAGVQYAGYALATTLELDPPPGKPVRLGVWNLLQLPQPGTMLIPTHVPTRPHVVFGTPAAGELTEAPGHARWNMAPPGPDAKIGIKAKSLTGRAGHLRETGIPGIRDLVVREFSVGDERDYVDALWEPPYETGWAFQACCVRNGGERFNELEYHAPAVSPETGLLSGRDESRVWAFRGSAEAIRKVASVLLGLRGD